MDSKFQLLFTRRDILKKGFFGGALLAMAGGGALALRGGKRVAPPSGGLRILDPREYAIFNAIAQRVVPGGPAGLSPAEVAQNADAILAKAPRGAQKDVKRLLRLFENALAGFFFGGRAAPFTRLSPKEQDQVLMEWRDSRWQLRRTGYQALRSLALAGYYSSPLSWPEAAYPGPPQGFYQPEAPPWRGGDKARPE
jgi:hypothetical protein